jgi:hypothetical protein
LQVVKIWVFLGISVLFFFFNWFYLCFNG